MAERRKTNWRRSSSNTNQEKEQESELAIKVLHLGKEYIVRFPVEADSRFICEAVKTQAGVKGAFYLHGDGVEGYLHSSSLTRANLEKFGSKPVEVRGGGWINNGGGSCWYYHSQKLRPEVQTRITLQQQVPFDSPP